MKKSVWIVLALLICAFAAVNISMQKREKKNAPVKQNIEAAKIAVTAPPMARQELLEQKIKEKLKEKVKNAYFFSSSYKKADYLIYYCEYKSEVKLQKGIDSLVSKFKDRKLVYETKENEIGEAKGILLDGTFEVDGKKYGIKQQLIKLKKSFWQVLTIYPYSEKNKTAADNFINSVLIGGSDS